MIVHILLPCSVNSLLDFLVIHHFRFYETDEETHPSSHGYLHFHDKAYPYILSPTVIAPCGLSGLWDEISCCPLTELDGLLIQDVLERK